jgi:hypothetical protein
MDAYARHAPCLKWMLATGPAACQEGGGTRGAGPSKWAALPAGAGGAVGRRRPPRRGAALMLQFLVVIWGLLAVAPVLFVALN